MSFISHLNEFLQSLRKVQLPKFQPELESRNIDSIEHFVPSESLAYLKTLINGHAVVVEISKARNTKQGDFRPPPKGQLPKITINHNLNPYSFLITFIHEWAHLLVYENYNLRVRPHGTEWKSTYQILLAPLLEITNLDTSFKSALSQHIKKPKASTLGDVQFAKFLKRYDEKQVTHLEDIPENAIFELQNGLVLVKGERRRTRYLCKELNGDKQYTVHAIAEVTPAKPTE